MAITFSHTQRSTMGGGTQVKITASDDTIDTILFWRRKVLGLRPNKIRQTLVSAAARLTKTGLPQQPLALTILTDGASLMFDYQNKVYYLSAQSMGGQAAHALKSAMAEIRMLEAVALANYRAHQCVTKFFEKGRNWRKSTIGSPTLRVEFNRVDNFGRPVRDIFDDYRKKKAQQAPEGCTSRPRPGTQAFS